MKLPGTWATVNNVRTYVPAPETPVLLSHDLVQPPERRILAATRGREWSPPAAVTRGCQWCGKRFRHPGAETVCSGRCHDSRRAFLTRCGRYGLDGSRLLAAHIDQEARIRSRDYDRPVPTPYALSLLRDRGETGGDGVRMAASFHADRLCEMISENKIDLARVAGFD